MKVSSGRRYLTRGAVAFVAAGTLGMGAVGASQAGASTAPHGPRLQPRLFDAKVSAIGSGNFTVLSGHRTTTVDVNSSTTYSEPGVRAASFANLAVGERVHVRGTATATAGVVTGLQILIHPFPTVDVEATVSAIGSGNFTVLNGHRTTTVDVNSSTTYSEPGVASPGFANLAVGERVNVLGVATATPGVVTATRVLIHPFPTVDFDATVTAIGSGNFTVLNGHRPTTVDVNSSTTYSELGVASASFASLSVGERVHVHGTATATAGVVTGLQVFIHPFRR